MSEWSYCYKRHHVHVKSSLADLQHVCCVTFWNGVCKWVLKRPLLTLGLRDWNEMFAVRFLCFVLLTDCDHQGAVVLHSKLCLYGTEVMFSEFWCCKYVYCFWSACYKKLSYCLFIHAFLCWAAVLGETRPHRANPYQVSPNIVTLDTFKCVVLHRLLFIRKVIWKYWAPGHKVKFKNVSYIKYNISFCHLWTYKNENSEC